MSLPLWSAEGISMDPGVLPEISFYLSTIHSTHSKIVPINICHFLEECLRLTSAEVLLVQR